MKVQIKNIVDIPKNAHETDAGYDVIATSDPVIVGKQVFDSNCYESIDYIEYGTNLYLAPEHGNHIDIRPRSSISNYNLMLKNSVGLADESFRGQYMCRFAYIFQPEDLIIEDSWICCQINKEKIYKKGDKIGQIVGCETKRMEFISVSELPPSDRGACGFGSTGN